jgi:hypothetical protein
VHGVAKQSSGDEETGGGRGREGAARELKEWEWAAEMRGWAGGESPAGRPDAGASEIEVVGQGLVEVEGTDAKRWSGTGSGSTGSKAGV